MNIGIEELMWVAAFLTFGLGDTITTHIGLGIEGIEEKNTIAEILIGQFGVVGMLLTKGAALLSIYFINEYGMRFVGAPHNIEESVSLVAGTFFFILGIALVVNNLSVIAEARWAER